MFEDLDEAPREAAVDLGCGPGPLALLTAASLDPGSLSAAAELDLIGLVERSITVAQALRSTLIADYADRAPCEPRTEQEQRAMDWHREQLAAVCQTSPHEADVRCQTAVALRERLAATAAAVRSGSLPWAQAVVLARESRELDATASSAVERIVLADPRAVSVRDVRDATRAAVEQVRPSATDQQARDAHERRFLQMWPGDDGTTDLHAVLTTDAAIVVAAALDPLTARSGPDDDRTVGQRRADALVALALGDSADPDDESRGDAVPRPRVNLTVLARTDLSPGSDRGLFGGLLAGGWVGASPIGSETLRRLTCDAVAAAATVTADGTVGPEGPRRRFPDAALRRRLEARDHRRTFPGCRVPARRCHGHHLRHYARGGPTTDENMILTCHRHHQAVHEGGWTLRGTATSLRWYDPDGRRYDMPVSTAHIPAWTGDPPTFSPSTYPTWAAEPTPPDTSTLGDSRGAPYEDVPERPPF